MTQSKLFTKDSGAGGLLPIMRMAKSIALCYGVTALLLAVFAVIVTYTPFPERAIRTAVLLLTALSVAVAGLLTARGAARAGWLCGCVSGAVYVITLYLLGGCVFRDFSFGLNFLTMLLIGAFSGTFGGMVGVNTKR
jgi:putative membrane protein (TIGR04086 family)